MENKKNNFKSYQAEKVTKRLSIIQEQIAFYKKKKVNFKNITAMAETLSEYITKQEGTSCSSSTILRNEQYKGLIETYFYSQNGIKNPREAYSLINELTLSNVERENHRLKQYITSLENELNNLRNKRINNTSVPKNNQSYLNNEDVNSANLKKAFNLLIQHFAGLVALNENGDLVDLTKRVNNVIVSKRLIN